MRNNSISENHKETNTVLTELHSGQSLTVKDNELYVIPNFNMIGNGMAKQQTEQVKDMKMENIHLIREMMNFTKSEQLVFGLIATHDNMNHKHPFGKLGIVKLLMSDVPTNEHRSFKRGYKILSEKRLILRMKRSHYMINPNAMFNPLEYKEAQTIWIKLKDKSDINKWVRAKQYESEAYEVIST